MPPVHRPPGAASTFLILPCSVTRSRQRTVPVIGYRSDGSPGAAKPPGIPYPQAARALSFYMVPSCWNQLSNFGNLPSPTAPAGLFFLEPIPAPRIGFGAEDGNPSASNAE